MRPDCPYLKAGGPLWCGGNRQWKRKWTDWATRAKLEVPSWGVATLYHATQRAPDVYLSRMHVCACVFVCVKSLQSCPTLCDPVDCSPLGSSVHGISQTRILEWGAFSFSRGSSQTRDQTHRKKVKSPSRVRLFATPWTSSLPAPPSMGFSRQEYWSGLPFPSPGDLPNPGIEPRSPAFQADALTSETPGKPCLLHFLHWQMDSSQLVTINCF